MDVDSKKKAAAGDSQRVGLDNEGDRNRIIQRQPGMRGTRNAANGRKLGDENERYVDQQVRTEWFILEETEDSPQFATGTTYDLDKRGEDIIDLVDEEPSISWMKNCRVEIYDVKAVK